MALSDDIRMNEQYLQAVACAVARDRLVMAMADCIIDCARVLDANFRVSPALPSIDRLSEAMKTFQEFLPR